MMMPDDFPFLAGAAAVEVTPPRGCYLAGYGQGRMADEVLDPLWARAVAWRCGPVTAAVVALDCLAVTVAQAEAIAAATPLPLGPLLVCATHCHSGPDTIGLWGPEPGRTGVDEAVVARLVAGAAEAVNEALARLQPAVMTMAQTPAPPRCAVNVRAPGSLDKTINVLHLATAGQGRAIATLVNWACHPEVLSRQATQLSSDFADALRRRLEDRLGGTAIFVNGALGAMVTAASAESTPAEAARIGEAVADQALVALRSTDALIAETHFAIATREVALAVEPTPLRESLAALGPALPLDADGYYRVPVSAWSFGPATWLAIPAEVAPALWLAWKRTMQRRHRLLIGLANGEIGYLLPTAAWTGTDYAYEQSMSFGESATATIQSAVEEVLAAVEG